MNITSTKLAGPKLAGNHFTKTSSKSNTSAPGTDSFTFSSADSTGFFGLGLASGVVGVGAPAALAMGSAKLYMNGQPLLATGLAAASLVAAGTVGTMALMGAAMSTDSGESAGINGYFTGAALSTAASGLAIFAL